MAGESNGPPATQRLPAVDGENQRRARRRPRPGRGGGFLARLLGSVISKVIIGLVLALVIAYLVADKIAHLNIFGSHTTITTTVVLGKLTKIEQVHVATRSYPVDVKITQSVGIIPCFLICNEMELKGSGTDDAVVDLATLSKRDVSIDQGTQTVTVRMAPPAVAAAVLDPAACDITSGHGVINSATQDFRNNPNGYRPLYAAAQTQIHSTALHDHDLLSAGEQSTRELLTRILGTVGVKKVIVNFG
jgi:Protein of unknown function (DUF4230)